MCTVREIPPSLGVPREGRKSFRIRGAYAARTLILHTLEVCGRITRSDRRGFALGWKVRAEHSELLTLPLQGRLVGFCFSAGFSFTSV